MKLKLTLIPPFRLIPVLATVFGLLYITDSARGATVISLEDSDPGPGKTTATIIPSGAFTFSVFFDIDERSQAVSFQLLDPGFVAPIPGCPNRFTITMLDRTGSVYSAPTSSSSPLTSLSPRSIELGATLPVVFTTVPAARYLVANITFAGPAAPGDYILQTVGQEYTDANENGISIAPATYAVHVVPEPRAGCLLFLGVSLLGWARRKRIA